MKLDVLYNKSCQKMSELPDNSIPLMATDPPYAIGFMNKEWDKFDRGKQTKSQVVNWMRTTMKKDTRGMMEFFTPIWKEALRVLKPGAFAFVMCIPRQDCLSRMIVSLENAGFDVGFTPMFHAFASGFPKAQNVSKIVEKRNKKIKAFSQGFITAGDDGRKAEFKQKLSYRSDYGYKWKPASPQAQALDGSYGGFQPKPAVEVVIVAMKPLSEKSYLDQALKNRKGVTWLDEGRIPFLGGEDPKTVTRKPSILKKYAISYARQDEPLFGGTGHPKGRFPGNLLVSNDALNDGKKHKIGKPTGGFGAMGIGIGKPLEHQPYVYAGKKYKVKGFVENCRPQAPSNYNDSGSFSRYFSLDAWFEKKFKELPKNIQKTFPFLIVSKASKSEKNKGCEKLFWEKDDSSFGCHQIDGQRWMHLGKEEERIYKKTGKRISLRARGNIHPTVKTLKLFCYLLVLGSREGDVVLDPFFGSGTTGVAARMLGRHYIGYETGPENVRIAKARLSTVESMLF